jgi:hypothetical protein
MFEDTTTGKVAEIFRQSSRSGWMPSSMTMENFKRMAMTAVLRSRDKSLKSEHHKYKVGTTAYYRTTNSKKGKYLSLANTIPRKLKAMGFTSHDSVGEGNATVHGEFRACARTKKADFMAIAVNTPCCANCAKSMIMRGVDAIIIDEKSMPGFKSKDDEVNPWTKDRQELWDNLVLPMLKKAKVPVYTANPDTGAFECIVEGVLPRDRPQQQHPARIVTEAELLLPENNPQKWLDPKDDVRRAIAVALDPETGERKYIFAQDSHPPGFSREEGDAMVKRFAGEHTRFHFPLDPTIQLAMVSAKEGLKLENGKVFTNWIPSSGRQLDLAYIGITQIHYTLDHLPSTLEALDAMDTLSSKGLISYHEIGNRKNLINFMKTPKTDMVSHLLLH